MSFMKLQIERGQAYLVETEIGTEIVPADIVSHYGMKPGETLSAEDADARWLGICQAIRDYCEGEPTEITLTAIGYLGRYSASGYMDCTDWEFDTNRRRLERDLRAMYG